MYRKLIGLLAAGILVAGCSSVSGIISSVGLEGDWENACYWTEKVSEVENICAELEEPTVVMSSKLVMRIVGMGGLGFFIPSESNIYISPDRAGFYGVEVREIVVHEMVHYILDQYAPETSRCSSEEAARIVTDLYMGRPYDSTWRDRYSCIGVNYGLSEESRRGADQSGS